jgi:hypothetical protein
MRGKDLSFTHRSLVPHFPKIQVPSVDHSSVKNVNISLWNPTNTLSMRSEYRIARNRIWKAQEHLQNVLKHNTSLIRNAFHVKVCHITLEKKLSGNEQSNTAIIILRILLGGLCPLSSSSDLVEPF